DEFDESEKSKFEEKDPEKEFNNFLNDEHFPQEIIDSLRKRGWKNSIEKIFKRNGARKVFRDNEWKNSEPWLENARLNTQYKKYTESILSDFVHNGPRALVMIDSKRLRTEMSEDLLKRINNIWIIFLIEFVKAFQLKISNELKEDFSRFIKDLKQLGYADYENYLDSEKNSSES
ncbi:MAG: hypothetical protein SFU25_10640, partial [Candidatus Caenarcaniphilales bacterium]|nr:hypothetical protein [Candidatus Caenarcaniphilales bacterium]